MRLTIVCRTCKILDIIHSLILFRVYVSLNECNECQKVFCEMTLNGGGYTFLKPSDIPRLSDAELQAIFTDRTSYLLRTRLTDGTQQYGILRQLSRYR